MTKARSTLLLAALLAGGSAANAAPRRSAPATLTVVTVGTDQALKLGGATLPRPFGAQLVDRLVIVGRYPLAAGRTAWLVRGEGGADCPARYLVVSARAGEQPTVGTPFGTCVPGASARVQRGELIVTMADVTGQPARFAWSRGAIRPVGPLLEPLATIPGACAGDAPRSPDLLRTALDETLPFELRRFGGVRRADLDNETLQAMVADLACLAAWPGAEPAVPKAATPLFASKRYGSAAFAALDNVARTPGSAATLRAAVRAFSARMYYYVGRREPI